MFDFDEDVLHYISAYYSQKKKVLGTYERPKGPKFLTDVKLSDDAFSVNLTVNE